MRPDKGNIHSQLYIAELKHYLLSNRVQNGVNTTQMLLPLSRWTCSRGVEVSLVTARLEPSADLKVGHTKWRSPAEGVVGLHGYIGCTSTLSEQVCLLATTSVSSRASQILHKGCTYPPPLRIKSLTPL